MMVHDSEFFVYFFAYTEQFLEAEAPQNSNFRFDGSAIGKRVIIWKKAQENAL